MCGEEAIPCKGRLLQTKERFVETIDMVQTDRVNKARRLSAVDHPREGTMQEGILDVELVNRHSLDRARLRTVWMVASLMTGLKV